MRWSNSWSVAVVAGFVLRAGELTTADIVTFASFVGNNRRGQLPQSVIT